MTSLKKPSFDPNTLFQRALAQHQTGKLADAESSYRKLLQHFPNQPDVLTAYGTLLLQQNRQNEGIERLRRSLKIAPDQAAALFNLGAALQKMAALEEAMTCYDKAVKLTPDDFEIHLNLGNLLKDLRKLDQAAASYDRAIVLNPGCAPAHWNKSLLELLTGAYKAGWERYEWGWKCSERGAVRQFPQPRWTGRESIAGKTLLIHAEQGLGDVIQFCRYAPMAASLGAHVLLEAPPPLVPLLSTLNGDIRIIEKGKPLPDFDFYCPIMSLPSAFGTTLETIPAPVPYLYPTQEKLLAWRQKLGSKHKPRVGLVWSGSIANKIDLNPCSRRNIPLAQLKPLLELPIEFHMLQTEVRREDAAVLSKIDDIHVHQQALKDFADTAALVHEMDLVITVCTSMAHLAGAIGRETWVLLPYSPDYRWMLDRTDSPWYPTATLIRQQEIGDWSGVISEVTQRLETMLLA